MHKIENAPVLDSTRCFMCELPRSKKGKVVFHLNGPVSEKGLLEYSTSPTIVDKNEDGVWKILVAAKEGHFYPFKG